MRPLSRTLCASLLLLGANLCLQSAARAEVSLSFYTGTSNTRSSDLELRQPASDSDAEFRDVHWSPRPFEDAPYYGIRVTYFGGETSRIGGAFDFNHYKAYADTSRSVRVSGRWNGASVDETVPMNQRVQEFEVSHGVNIASLNLIYRWFSRPGGATPEGSLRPYVGAGIAHYFPHAEGRVDGRAVAWDYQAAGFGYQILGGLEYAVTRAFRLFAEAKFDRGGVSMETAGRSADLKLSTWHVIAGVSFSF